ncbi:hypothetical protein LADH09A_000117 [Micromonospora sp. LAH09]|uniref:hypothetical protein n=1 Tax=Micromonospora cabrerizensis TaxID=2911213 RepID=UPI001EE8AE30|nr:hypothetical protein [Micromonospora cabrerizensis]MCG5472293.1 hypothetical protein [Micromonospora cabrerizensis]
MNTVARSVLGAVLALAAATVVYAHGVWVGHFLDLRATTGYCPAKPLASTSTSAHLLPLRHTCHYADGTTGELVPAYVNPILFLCLAVGVACTALAVRSARRTARPSPTR